MQTPPASLSLASTPTLVVHGPAELRRAIDAAATARLARLCLLSAPSAACFLGPAWWRALMALGGDQARRCGLSLDDILDCGDAAGRALEALRLGQRVLVLAPSGQWQAVRDRADPLGAVLLPARPQALDLGAAGAERQLAAFLRPHDSQSPSG
ncbi:hypothetical protein NFI95_11365 [Acetobacteraceae bacterium KSS8]|uniref:Uncharacterized protein n=1 Tax=Endosaccharibacter trunci TaxID=2812733 RepID=A0ABT1WAB0_9PROT|nr:hypothetical protein [Acetobacteraceae bacterium KSS8]